MPNIDFSNLSVSIWDALEHQLTRKAVTVAVYTNKRKVKPTVLILQHIRAFPFNKVFSEADFLKKYKKPKCFVKYYKGKIYILPITVALEKLKD